MKRKLTGSATGAIILFVASGALASVLGLRQIERFTTVEGWVTSADLVAGQVLTPSLLKQERIDKDAVGGTIQNPRELIGRVLRTEKDAGDSIAAQDLKKPVRRSLSSAIPEGRVLYSMRQPSNSIPVAQLSDGDRFDVVVRGRTGVRIVARDVKLVGLNHPMGKASPESAGAMELLKPKSRKQSGSAARGSMVVAVRPGDVYPLASIGEGELVSLVLHSARDIAQGTLHNVVPASRFREVELVAGLERSKVKVQR